MLPQALETERMLLRPVTPADAEPLHHALTWEVVRWLSSVPWPLAVDDVATFAAQAEAERRDGTAFHYAMVVDGTPVGVVGLEPRHGAMSLGYWLGEAHWGRGLGREAATALVGGFFAATEAVHLASGVFAGNEASLRLQKKLGFIVVGEGLVPSKALQRPLPHYDTVLGRARWSDAAAAA
ncbi:GNAT family N-acetyltransferase [Chelatococcus sp. GCM10030263]|uniref:GNAT family N-acetyltransferase n=1 Tax=Chelatococcus sp. GCM10030263 TaxID=3273387 RepID=UPI00361FDA7A